ncbi:MAG: sulfotransferase family 2 domain-containing protein [Sphingomonadaceae bacterium]
MIVSRTKRFVFVHVPKTAGKAVSAALDPHASAGIVNPLHIHETLCDFYMRVRKEGKKPRLPFGKRSEADASAEFADYFSFAFVRNPWDRVVSMFSFLQKADLPETRGLEFGRFMHDLEHGAHYLQSIHNPRPQLDYITDYRRKIIVSEIGRFETLAEDFGRICDRLGIDVPLEKRNVSSHAHYTDYFDDRSRGFVANLYAEDISAFGYTFGADASQ